MTDKAPVLAGSASTEEPTRLILSIRCETDRPEYDDNVKRAGLALTEALNADRALQLAFQYLAEDTPFAVLVVTNKQRRIILPATVART